MDNPIKYSDLVAPDVQTGMAGLIAQLQELANTYTSSINKIKQEAQSLKTSLQGVNGATEEGRQTTRNAVSEAEKLTKAEKDLANAQTENARKIKEVKMATQEANNMMKLEIKLAQSAEGSYNKLSAQYSINKVRLNQMSSEMRHNTEEGRRLERETKAIYEQMKKLQEATGKHQLNVGNYPDMTNAIQGLSTKITGLIGLNGQLGSSFIQLGQNASGTTSILGGLKSGFSSLGSVLGGLLTNPVFLSIAGVAGAGFGVKAWYDYNNGLVEATRLTRELAEVSGQDLVNIRTYIQAMADTWGTDFKDTIQAVDAVSANFKISFEEASEAIKDGFVAGANLNGDFLAKLKQYPAYFKEAGLSARQFIAILTQTKSGIFGDQGLDAIKQANARIREMKDNVKNVLNELDLGMNAEEIEAQLTAGAMTTFDVLQMVSEKLAELPPQSQLVGETLVTVFGKQGRDAGLEMVKSLADIDTNLDVVKQKTGEFGALEEQQMVAQQELQKALATLFDSTNGSFENLTARVKIFATQALTSVVKGIVDIINWVIRLYNKSTTLRALCYGIAETVVVVAKLIGNTLQGLQNMIVGLAGSLMALAEGDWENVKKGNMYIEGGWKQITSQNLRAIGNYAHNMTHWNGGQQLQELGSPSAGSGNNYGFTGGVIDARNGGRHGFTGGVEDRRQGGTHGFTGGVEDRRGENFNASSFVADQQLDEVSYTPSTPTFHNRGTRTYSYGNPTSHVSVPTKTRNETAEQRQAREKAEEEKRIRDQENAYRRTLGLQRKAEDDRLKLQYQGEELRRRQLLLEYDRMEEDLRHQLEVEDKLLTDEDKKAIRERIGSIEELKERGLKALKQWEEEQIENERIANEKAKIADLKAEKDTIDLRLKAVEEGSAEELNLKLEKLEKEREIALAENKIAEHPVDEKLINNMFNNERKEIVNGYSKILESIVDKQNELENSEIELLETSERKKTQLRLQAEKDRIKKLLSLQKLGLIQLTQEEVKVYENQLKLIDKQLKTLPYGDIYDVLGLDLTDEQKQAIDTSMQYAQEAINTFMQAYVQEAERKASLADQAVEDTKRVLETEQEARANGYASNVEYAQKELDQSKRMQEKAHRQAVQAQRQQILLDSALQASSLITATAGIWKSAMQTKGIFGIPLAIATTALMWGAFTASKIKAMSMVGKDEEYGEGTVELLEGGSHQSGNDIDLGRKKDGTRRRAEGGEFFAVINKRNSRRFRKLIPDVINSLNNGTFPSKYMSAYDTSDNLVVNVDGNAETLRSLSSDVRDIRKQNERKTYVDGQGNIVVRYRNVTRTYKRV